MYGTSLQAGSHVCLAPAGGGAVREGLLLGGLFTTTFHGPAFGSSSICSFASFPPLLFGEEAAGGGDVRLPPSSKIFLMAASLSSMLLAEDTLIDLDLFIIFNISVSYWVRDIDCDRSRYPLPSSSRSKTLPMYQRQPHWA